MERQSGVQVFGRFRQLWGQARPSVDAESYLVLVAGKNKFVVGWVMLKMSVVNEGSCLKFKYRLPN